MLQKSLAAIATAAVTGALLMGAPAHAADNTVTSTNSSKSGGNELSVDLSVPVNVCGLGIGIFGNVGASC